MSPLFQADGRTWRAAYRGDKITKRVWHDISAGSYVVQSIIVFGEGVAGSRENQQALKFDIRPDAYDDQVQ